MITIDSLRNAYVRSFGKGGYVMKGESGLTMPDRVQITLPGGDNAGLSGGRTEMSEKEKRRRFLNSLSAEAIDNAEANGVDLSGTGFGSYDELREAYNKEHIQQGSMEGYVEAPGYDEVLRQYIESHPDEAGIATMPGLSDEEKYQVFLNHLTPQLMKDAFYENDDLGFNPNSKMGQAYFSKLKSDWLASDAGKAWSERMSAENEAGQREMGTRGRVFANMLGDDIEKERLAKAREAIDKDVASIDWDEYMKPVEEENIGNEGVTDYNDFYNNASRKEIRGVAHGKGWTNANGEELLWTGDNRKQNRQYARSERQGRRQDIRNIRNGKPKSEEYRYAPRFERNGGAMMRTFIGAMRRGGRL